MPASFPIRKSWRRQKPPVGTPINFAHSLAQGLIGAWLFNEQAGSDVHDLTTGVTSSLHPGSGTLTWKPETFGYGLDFNGSITDTYITAGYDPRQEPANGVTVVCWAQLRSLIASNYLVSKTGNLGSLNFGYSLYGSNTGVISWSVGNGSSAQTRSVATNTDNSHSDFSLHQYVGTYDANGNTVLYLDGKAISSAAASGTIAYQSQHPLYLGNYENSGTNPVNGIVDHVLVYNRGLNALDVERLYHEPYAFLTPPKKYFFFQDLHPAASLDLSLDLSATATHVSTTPKAVIRPALKWGQQKPVLGASIDWSNPLTNGLVGAYLFNEGGGTKVANLANGSVQTLNSTPVWQAARFGGGHKFNNDSSQYVDTGLVMGTKFTWLTWAFSNNSGSFESLLTLSGTFHLFDLNGGSGSIWNESSSGSALGISGAANTWNQLCYVREGDNLTPGYSIYQNGKLTGTLSSTTRANSNTVRIGNRSDAAQPFFGTMDHVLIFNRNLAAREIAQLYADPFQILRGRKSRSAYTAPAGQSLTGAAALDLSLDVSPTAKVTHFAVCALDLSLDVAPTAKATHYATAAVDLSLDVSPTAKATHFAATSLDLALDVTPTAKATHFAATSLDLALDVAPTAKATHYAASALDVSLDVAAAASLTAAVAASLDLTGDLTATVAVAHHASVALDLTGDLTASTSVARAVASALDLTGDLNATAAVAHHTAASLDLTGDLSATAAVAHHASVSLDLTGDLTASTSVARAVASALDVSLDLAASASVTAGFAAALDVSLDLAAAARAAYSGAASLDLTGDLSASTSVARAVASALDLTGNMSATAAVTHHAAASLDLTGDLTATAAVAHHASVALTLSADLNATVAVAHHASVSLDLTGDLSASTSVARAVAVALDLTGNMSATAHASLSAAAALVVDFDLTADLSNSGAESSLRLDLSLAASALVTRYATAAFDLDITLTPLPVARRSAHPTWFVDDHGRTFALEFDGRTFELAATGLVYFVDSHGRTITVDNKGRLFVVPGP